MNVVFMCKWRCEQTVLEQYDTKLDFQSDIVSRSKTDQRMYGNCHEYCVAYYISYARTFGSPSLAWYLEIASGVVHPDSKVGLPLVLGRVSMDAQPTNARNTLLRNMELLCEKQFLLA